MPRYNDYTEPIAIEGKPVTPGLVLFPFQFEGEERFHRVSAGEANRLDLISYAEYGDPQYFWLIALHNHIKDTFSVEAGTVLRIPSRIDEVLTQFDDDQWR